ncbi:MAG: PD40 domain-containing protein [Niastella sp.]|nr:PD40 domain-containing protein [Niastella sp.]
MFRTTILGGLPVRLTYFGGTDQVVDWTPDGKNILFASGRESGKERFNQFYTIHPNGGPATKLPLAYAEYGSYSPDGSQLAIVFRSQAFRNWKRYRGGTTADIYIFDFKTNTSKNISADTDAGEEFPMWVGGNVYFISDRGKENRMNLWSYDLNNGSRKQLTYYTDFDIQFPASGPADIVYEQGGFIHLFNIASGNDKK